jgi:hypothetical protein
MGIFRRSTPPGPPPAAPTPSPSSVVYEPATVEACKADYDQSAADRVTVAKNAKRDGH